MTLTRFFDNNILILECFSMHFFYSFYCAFVLIKSDKGIVAFHLDRSNFTKARKFFVKVLGLALARDFGDIDLGKRFTIIFPGFHIF
jgi:hypothetical protein